MQLKSKLFSDRMYRESRTIQAMIGIFCRDQHGLKVVDCDQCSQLQNYALDRLEHCPFGEGKTSCKNCPVHCYKPSMKEDVRQVMRYSGPRMLLRHPILTLFHFMDNRRKEPLSDYLTPGSSTKSDEECEGPIQNTEPS